MGRLFSFLLGALFAAGGGLFLVSSTYALKQAHADGAYREMLFPAIFTVISLIALIGGLRAAIRAILPGFTFTRVILVAALVIGLLHLGGYVSLSSENLREYANKVEQWMRSIARSVPEIPEGARRAADGIVTGKQPEE